MNCAFFEIDAEMLVEALCLPEDTRIDSIELVQLTGKIRVFVTHPDLPKHEPGQQKVCVSPTMTFRWT